MQNNKNLCERVHFKTRLLERYGIKINRHKYRDLFSLLNEDTLLLVQSNTKEIHEITIAGKQVWVVLDTMRGEFVTALEYECELRLSNAEVDDDESQQLLDAAYKRHQEILQQIERDRGETPVNLVNESNT